MDQRHTVLEPLSQAEGDETRQRLLDAAERIFAEVGYETTTVRAICEEAGVKNIGAVNYYFQGKEKLYTQVVKNSLLCCSEGVPFPEWATGTAAVQKLRDFIGVMMARFLQAPRVTAMQIMMRELTQPSPACREAVLQQIQPLAQKLGGILEELLPHTLEEKRWLIAFSIMGQCLYYRQDRHVAEILMGAEAFNRLDSVLLANHIADFTLAALGLAPPLLLETRNHPQISQMTQTKRPDL